jgi:hypothetical protein
MSRPAGVASPEGVPFFFTSLLGDNDFLRGHAYYFPIKCYIGKQKDTKLFSGKEIDSDWEANFSNDTMEYLSGLGIGSTDASFVDSIWMHALSIGFSPSYLAENADGIRRDWPRIPLPKSKDLLLASAKLGKALTDLLNSELVDGVTSGEIRQELGIIAPVQKTDGSAVNLETGDLNLTAEWGNIGKDRAVMPGVGHVVIRDYSSIELKCLSEGAASLGLSTDELVKLLGLKTVDVYLNDNVFWKCIPENVWNSYIGGYQVIKKWLSYRQYEILGRGLSIDEVREISNIARRIAAIIALYPALNRNYASVKSNTYPK